MNSPIGTLDVLARRLTALDLANRFTATELYRASEDDKDDATLALASVYATIKSITSKHIELTK
jgi:hypothetical protein